MAAVLTSFAADIRPMFRAKDVESMRRGGLDLSSYDEVAARADAILGRLQSGSMPCDGPWPADRIVLFARWIGEGRRP